MNEANVADQPSMRSADNASQKNTARMRIFLLISVATVLSVCTWFNASQRRHLVAVRLDHQGFPARNFSDLYPRWLGSRELLLHKRDPYSNALTQEIEQGYYGRPIDVRNPTDPVDEQRFAYPLFVVFLLAPVIGLPFPSVQIIFGGLLFISAVISLVLWARMIGIPIRSAQAAAALLLCIGALPYSEALQYQQLGILVALFIAIALMCVMKDRMLAAGILLSLATIKPQLSLPLIVWLMAWSSADWKSRKKLLIAFSLSLAALIAASEILLPGWMAEFTAGLHAYLQYTHATTSMGQLLGKEIGGLALMALSCIAAYAAWRTRRRDAGSAGFVFTAALVLALSCAIVPSLASSNQILVLPAYLALLKWRRQVAACGRLARAILAGAWLLAAWPFVFSTLAAFRYLILNQQISWTWWMMPLATNPLIPVMAFLALIPLLGSSTLVLSGWTPDSHIIVKKAC